MHVSFIALSSAPLLRKHSEIIEPRCRDSLVSTLAMLKESCILPTLPKKEEIITHGHFKKKKNQLHLPFSMAITFRNLHSIFINISPVRELSKLELGPIGSP